MTKRRRGYDRTAGPRVRAGSTTRTTPASSPIPWPLVILVGALALLAIAFFGPLGGRLPFGAGGPGTQAPGGGAPTPVLGADGCPTTQPPALPAGETRIVTIDTELGAIEIEVTADLSPIAAGNFVALASCGYYDGVVFHRVVPTFVIQGGDPTGTGTGGPGYTIQDEPVSETYRRGTVAMARTPQPNSVGSQFFIVLDDAARGSLERANTYQIIGSVSSGMDVVDAIAAAADAENPSDPVAMTDVSVANP
jgi:cyclophilin family peptidyl-prolyl cis-trans isomerase